MSEQKLKNAPLKEVIFELFWEGTTQPNELPQDPGFENAVGKFQERLASVTPVQKRLYPISAPVKVFRMPIFQYWKKELKWPVIQHGPGMMSIHETETNYIWDTYFQPLIEDILRKLLDSYGGHLVFNRVSLKYIDAFDVEDMQPNDFVNRNLRMRLDVDYPEPGRKEGFGFLQQYRLHDQSLLQLQVNSGANNATGRPAIVLVTSIEKSGRISKEGIMPWLKTAHDHCSVTFKTMLNPEFYASLDK